MKRYLFFFWSVLFLSCAQTPLPKVDRTLQNSGVTASLRGLCAVSKEVVWASGSQGTCLRTLDGGVTWTRVPVPGGDACDFRDVQAWDAQRAVLLSAGSPARIFRTTDGGQTWSQTYFNDAPEVFFNGMAFWDDQNGLACSDPVVNGDSARQFLVIRTGDGGATWRRVAPSAFPAPLKDEAGFAASGTGLALSGKTVLMGLGGPAARVIVSSDSGQTWHAVETAMRHGTASQGIFSICLLDDNLGIAVGGDYTRPHLAGNGALITFDGGNSWQLADVQPGGYRSCLAPFGLERGVLSVGRAGSDISLDAGRTWARLDTVGYYVASFPGSEMTGWAAGSEGRIARIDVFWK